MKKYKVCILWGNKDDAYFVSLLKKELKQKRLSYFEVTFSNLADAYEKVKSGKLSFDICVDRASVDDASFAVFVQKLKEGKTKIINDPEEVLLFGSKSKLHVLFEKNKIPVPKTYIIKGGEKKESKQLKKIIASLGTPFVLKPSYGGFFQDVNLKAKEEKDILLFQRDHNVEDTLAQKFIMPRVSGKRTIWFRIISVFGTPFFFWWDPKTHKYTSVKKGDIESATEKKIISIMKKIRVLVELDIFSTEITIDSKGTLFVIDYVNQPIDLSSSKDKKDGLPPRSLKEMTRALVNELA